ncbi:hypothetical protein TUM17377_05380 [Shewanella chilikensis]|jgi:hypothetical protein|nr:hypothetical protein TUM17377_05380 [Shewanella chilikensis]GHB16258.1 hypothetical protein GCM10007107_31580 [Shewanella indica]
MVNVLCVESNTDQNAAAISAKAHEMIQAVEIKRLKALTTDSSRQAPWNTGKPCLGTTNTEIS